MTVPFVRVKDVDQAIDADAHASVYAGAERHRQALGTPLCSSAIVA